MPDIKPALVIMAAGMGSRYGGLKQIDPVDEQGDKILDFSIYDALQAGFGKVVFIIKKENEKDFREALGDRVAEHIPVEYAFQSLSAVPEGFKVPEKRSKPWGTAQAVLSARELLDTPFAVINADDFYGRTAFKEMRDFLVKTADDELYRYGMAGFKLKNTLTENGSVARGICKVTEDGYLSSVTERTSIEPDGEDARYTEDGGKTWQPLSGDSIVSMNFWGFGPSILPELDKAFKLFLEKLPESTDPLKAECYLPMVVDSLIRSRLASVNVLPTFDKWFGVTYREDKKSVSSAIQKLKADGIYPEYLWK